MYLTNKPRSLCVIKANGKFKMQPQCPICSSKFTILSPGCPDYLEVTLNQSTLKRTRVKGKDGLRLKREEVAE